MTTCILTALLGLSIMNFPVHAQETQANQQVESNSVSIQNMESLLIGQSMFKTAVQALTAAVPNNAGPFYVEGDSDGWAYDDANKTLTFTKDGTYKVTGDGEQTDVQIVVSKITTTLTVKDVTCYQPQRRSGMSIDGEANVTLVSEGKNEFVADKSSNEAGIQFERSKNGKLIIEGKGSLVATGDSLAAGIGGGYSAPGNNITINSGTIIATGKCGAGIGGGRRATSNNITINGGTITAIAEISPSDGSGAGIGGGEWEKGKNIIINGGTITTTSASGAGIGNGTGIIGDSSIVINGGSVKSTGAEAISGIPTDGNGNPVYLAKLDIAEDVKQIKVDGKDYKIEGKHENDTNYYLYMATGEYYIETESNVYKTEWDITSNSFKDITTPIETGDLKVTGGSYGIDYIYDSSANTLTFKTSGNFTVTGNGNKTTESIIVKDNIENMTITLNNVKSSPGEGTNANKYDAALSIGGTSKVTLLLEEKNEFYSSGGNVAGIEFNDVTTGSLTIDGRGSLIVRGGTRGAGIGGRENGLAKNITINGGVIDAKGGSCGAGIGGGKYGEANAITIKGGTVTATGGDSGGAGIGGGLSGAGTDIRISGGTVIAKGEGAGIGGGDSKGGNNIMISGGTVIAKSGRGAGIGGGAGEKAENITISGGTVTTKSTYGAGIGDGENGTKSSGITIIGGSVKATKNDNESISVTPTDGNNQRVYLAKLPNQDNVNEVTVDSAATSPATFKRAGNHPDGDTNFYLYLTGENHIITANQNKYKATWDKDSSTFTINPIAPTPTEITTTQTASTITVTEPADAITYGGVMYSKDNQNWQTSNIFENLDSSKDYTIYMKYKGNNTYIESEVAQITVKTLPATYTITIPSTTLTAGNSESKNEIKVSSMDIGYRDKVNVKILGNANISNDGMLTLTRQSASNTITSALLVNGVAFTNIKNNIATFTKSNKDPVSISFAKPTQTNIPAGTYNGTVTFEVTYTQQGG